MKVLLATEGSEFSRAAIEKCCAMFDKSPNTEIEVVSAAEPMYVPIEPFAVSAEYIQQADEAASETAKSAVSDAEQRIRERFPALSNGLTTKVLKGQPSRAIVEEAEEWKADLIVMGSHGYGFWNRTFLGSVSDSVVHHAPCSVLVVRGGDEPTGRQNGQLS